MNKIKLLLIFIFVSVLSFSSITMYTNTNKIAMNEGLEITIEFIDTDKGNYIIEGLDDFEVISRSSSSYFSSVNFKSSKKLVDKYVLKPSKIGKLSLEVKTKTEKSNKLNIEVLNQYDNKTDENIAISKGNTQLEGTKYYYSKNNLENKTLYFGQKAVYEEDFIVLKQLRGFEYKERPLFTDLSIKDYTSTRRNTNEFQREVNSQGVSQFRLNLFSGIFQGNSSGKKIIKTAKVEVVDDKILYLGGKNITVEIIPLPEGKIESYRDIVGDLNLESKWSSVEIENGKTVTLNLKLYGDVNLDNIKTIDIQKNSKYNVFETIKNEVLEIREGKVYSEKDFEIVFVPKGDGEIVIPSIKIGYFNTRTKKYEEKIVPEQIINVEPNLELSEDKTLNNINILKEEDVLNENETKTSKNEEVSFKFVEEIKENSNVTPLNIALFIIVILEGLLIFYLLIKNKKKKVKEISSLKDFEKVKTQDEFHRIYCEYMKKYHNFNPTAHSESRLDNNTLIEINRIMEGYKYSKKDFNMKEIIKRLEEVEKGE
ncbi:MAG: BatD family protein [Fusobacteriaceae bacterium]